MTSVRRISALAAAVFMAACSQNPTTPSAVKSSVVSTSADGLVQGALAGDVQVGGAIDLNLLRVAQNAEGGVPAFYAYAGGTYTVRPKLAVEIYAQIWTATNGVTNPRFVVEWGNGERENTSCGGCRLSHTYPVEGTYTVKVILDDRISSTTTRTFTLNVTSESGPQVARGFGTFNGELAETDPLFDRWDGDDFVGLPAPACQVYESTSFHYDIYPIHHLGGPLTVETIAASFFSTDAPTGPRIPTDDDTYLMLYSGSFASGNACQNIVAADDDNGGGHNLSRFSGNLPAGDYFLVVSSYNEFVTGTYTVVIQ